MGQHQHRHAVGLRHASGVLGRRVVRRHALLERWSVGETRNETIDIRLIEGVMDEHVRALCTSAA